ncbi:uncharacterized protein LOC123315760 [Coccinella septempunctata]|uniref:uncharacterized protein LOC123315759 n=1 Tax=Coccinella septempunctata TaxID=41139 RepID=UPI001D095D62|nr:uncharacterized protein LOC123315759 [Coccinella septempunctata]XP_044757532.1 uncharacterized protein LOC123315760 [Coccinella septempunctata]
MGNPASPIFAEIIMNALLLYVCSQVDFLIPFLYIYVDDIIMAIPGDKIQVMLELFNSFHQDLRFTYEVENNGTIPFLDLILIKENNKVIFDIYQKPTASGRILHYKSFHEFKHKISIIKNIRQKILNLSHPSFHMKNFNFFSKMLRENGYPKSLINNIFYASSVNNPVNAPENNEATPSKKTFKLIFIPMLTKQLIHALSSSGVRIVCYYRKTIKNFFSKLKDLTPKMLQSNLIYKVNCKSCQSSYVGQTKQYLKNRMKQHENDCKSGNFSTGLSFHHRDTGHIFDFEEPEILSRENNLDKRIFKEMIFIKKTTDNVNVQSDTSTLNNIYINLVR